MRERDTYFSKIQFYIVQPDSWLRRKQLSYTFSNYCCNCLKDVGTKRKQLRTKDFGIPWKCVFEAETTRKERRKNHQNFPFKLNRQLKQQHPHQHQQQQQHQQHQRYHHSTLTSTPNKFKIRTCSGFPRLYSHNSTILVLNFISHLLTLLLMILLLLTQQTHTTTATAATTTKTLNQTIPSRNPDWMLKYLSQRNSIDDAPLIAQEFNKLKTHDAAKSIKNFTKSLTEEELLQFVKEGLGMGKLPDMSKVNISQEEYEGKYKEYLRRQYKRKRRDIMYSTILQKPWSNLKSLANGHLETPQLNFFSFRYNPTYSSHKIESKTFRNEKYNSLRKKRIRKSVKRRNKSKMLLHFTLKDNEISAIESSDIEEANLRFILIYKRKGKQRTRHFCKDGNHKNNAGASRQHELLLNIYERLPQQKRLWLDVQKIEGIDDASIRNETKSQWLQFDVTKAIQALTSTVANGTASLQNLKFEIHCDNCKRFGYSTRILNGEEYSSDTDHFDGDDNFKMTPVLNVITRTRINQSINAETDSNSRAGEKDDQAVFPGSCPAETDSNKKHPRCCRHVMHVTFKEIKGFEFIIQPKSFDAGFCFGRCPPRFNPAHHHAMLQSLVWKQYEGAKAPRPCCAPSKLVELEVLHVDEENSEQLKVSTWTDMRVVECACS